MRIDGRPITCAEDVQQALTHSNGTITLQLQRKGKQETLTLQPEITKDGPKLGVFLKEGVTGIGTVTYYDPDTGTFGTLGHGVSDPDGGILKLVKGNAYTAQVASVQKGQSGQPGQLRGALCSKEPIGTLTKNTNQGLFGKAQSPWSGQVLPIAPSSEIEKGSATILATVGGSGVQEYSVEILKIYPQTRNGDKNMLIRVTDPKLLEATGGIVQGMSGSPIIQHGKLVGAVTHVLVNDPTRGYGIFIENMLDAAA
jgi:stage IV sporulation protein B